MAAMSSARVIARLLPTSTMRSVSASGAVAQALSSAAIAALARAVLIIEAIALIAR
jgi:hypothetical protein